MANKELLQKIIAMQDRIFKQMDELDKEGKITSDLKESREKIEQWAKAVNKEEGNDKSYREWPPKQFAHDLKKHINAFGNHEGTQLIQEYEELVGKLPYDHDREHV